MGDRPPLRILLESLRSENDGEYEKAYHWLQGRFLLEHIDRIIELHSTEADPDMRAKYLELIGDADRPQDLHILQSELTHPSRVVRFWAHLQLKHSKHLDGRLAAAERRRLFPDDDGVY